MTCCSTSCAAAVHFDPKKGERDLRRYQRRGPDRITRLLLAELRRSPLAGLHLLDVGSGIGVIAAELAGDGLTGVTLADASPAYLDVARHHVGPRYSSRPRLLLPRCKGAASPGGHALAPLAFTYPRDKWFVRAGFILENFCFASPATASAPSFTPRSAWLPSWRPPASS
ncbi:MAG: hypothetical protein DMG35_21135 [Acidobacteria bacterium]|nr:MAG: hypothetical protein DMG35_21135 [Acidobacteriota bacterium]